jgi:hypothetical protein
MRKPFFGVSTAKNLSSLTLRARARAFSKAAQGGSWTKLLTAQLRERASGHSQQLQTASPQLQHSEANYKKNENAVFLSFDQKIVDFTFIKTSLDCPVLKLDQTFYC